VRTDQLHVFAMLPSKLSQSFLVVATQLSIVSHDILEQAQASWARVRCGEFVVVEVGVAAVEQPTLAGVHGDPRVTGRVTRQWHHRDLDREIGKQADALEAKPAITLQLVLGPSRSMGPLGLDVAAPLAKGRVPRRSKLGRKDVDLRLGEVSEATSVIDVQVREGDMPHVSRIEAHPLDLPDRRFTLTTPRPDERAERLAQTLGGGHIGGAEARVHESEAITRLDQEAVRDESRLRQGPAAASE